MAEHAEHRAARNSTARQDAARDWAKRERAACGIGFIADLSQAQQHPVLDMALEALANLAHRGALGADGTTTDGTGVLTQIPRRLLRRELSQLDDVDDDRLAVGCLFLPPEAHVDHEPARRLVESCFQESGLRKLAWRTVPVDASALGYLALSTLPEIVHVVVERPDEVEPGDAFERLLYLARRRLEKAAQHAGLDELAVVSLSSRTIVYKSMAEASRLPEFYPDLKDPWYRTRIALFHQRFSTNTLPTWRLAQPFRLLAHNGEINTLQGNYNWMRTREPQLENALWGDDLDDLLPILERADSDSAMLDKVLELLIRSGRDARHALSMLLPPASREASQKDDAVRAFFEFHHLLIEPWDGPAAIVATDGRLAVAAMDRNGLRPLRSWQTSDDLLVVASEAGVVPLPAEKVVRKSRLGPGEMLAVDLEDGRIESDDEIKHALAAERPYRRWLDNNLEQPPGETSPGEASPGEASPGEASPGEASPGEASRRHHLQLAFGYSTEALDRILEPMAHGKLPVGSMGNDAPLALLSEQPQLLYSYFKQRFAQVTNPPIDPLRERLVFDLETIAGGVSNLLADRAEAAKVARFPSPVLSTEQFEWLLGLEGEAFRSARLDLSWQPAPEGASSEQQGERLRQAVEALAERAVQLASEDATILVLSDSELSAERPTIPMLLAVAAVHTRLIQAQRRMTVALVCETAEPREDHHVACLLGFGATLVYPYLAFQTVAARAESFGATTDEAVAHYRQALDKGLLKILSRLGVCPMVSYHGAQLFEALGLDRDLVDTYFPGTPNRLGGAGLRHIAADVLAQHAAAFSPDSESAGLPDRGLFRFRRGGEHHDLQPKAFKALHKAVRQDDRAAFDVYSRFLDGGGPSRLRHLLDWRPLGPPLPLDEVEPATSIARRFATAAMSLGALSREAHEALAIAMNRLGGRSNSGEGGEDPIRFERYREHNLPRFLGRWQPEPGDLASSAIKQVASGRFGVTAHYLTSAREIEIKMAQGSKPGEGGQIPGHKVTPEIARLRRSTPGVALISPPPHHDIYSIEDLAQLIYDLKRVNGDARLCVKLVSLSGVGTIACGVAKAHADIVLISGDDGGTGASPLSSIKHAGMPWELGLAEAQQNLVANDLRQRVTLRVDGGLRTGRDVLMAALLGAEEFGFGTAPLIALGCVMARQCHSNTCPVGVATQREDLRARFPGEPEHVVRFLTFVAEQVREALAAMGARRLDEIIGRFDLVVPRDGERARQLGLDFLDLWQDPDPSGLRPRRRRWTRNQPPRVRNLDQRLLEDVKKQISLGEDEPLLYTISNRERTVGARVSGWIAKSTGGAGWAEGRIRAHFDGAAGQSFGAFLVRGLELRLRGDAQDGVGKGMSGGRLVLAPPDGVSFEACEQVIAGNAMLYGATGGELFAAGRVGERFCVRNSGATAVVEGCGDHGCEYMTAGRALILGPVGRNFAAGMSGGIAHLYDPQREAAAQLNEEMVELLPASREALGEVRRLLESHARLTDSQKARALLDDWPRASRAFVTAQPQGTGLRETVLVETVSAPAA